MLQQQKAAWAECTCAGAAHRHFSYSLLRGLDRALPLPRPFIALPRTAPHRATWGRQERGNPQNKEQDRYAYAPRLRTYTQPAQLFAAGVQLTAHTQPALRAGLMAPAWRFLHVFRRVIPGLMTCHWNKDGAYTSSFSQRGFNCGYLLMPDKLQVYQ